MDVPPTAPTPPTLPASTLPPALARRSPLVAAILGWAFPGLGQLYAGRPLKALIMLGTICGLFYWGLALTGFTCVDPYTYGLEFVAHAWIGGPTAWAYWSSREIVLADPMPYLEVGRLYVAVAGLLNIVAICDAVGSVLEHNARAEDRDALRLQMEQDHLDAIARLEVARAEAAALELDVTVDLDGEEPPRPDSAIDWAAREDLP